MKAVILAAGRGNRLRPLTDTIPKPMVDFRGAPLLEYTLSILPEQIDEIIIIIGWLGDQIEKYFGRSFAGREVGYIKQNEPRGPFDALKRAKDKLGDGHFLVVSGDDIYHHDDLQKVASSIHLSLLTSETDTPERFGVCRLDNDGFLAGIVEKPRTFCGNLVGVGVYKLNSKIFDEPIIYGANGEEYLSPMVGTFSSREKVEVVRASFWHPIADMNDWRKAQKLAIK